MEARVLQVVASVDHALRDEVHALTDQHQDRHGHPGLSAGRLRALDAAAATPTHPLLAAVARRDAASGHLVGWSQIDDEGIDPVPTLEVVVLDDGPVGPLADAVLTTLDPDGVRPVRWWVSHASVRDDARAVERSFTTERDLLQLRCPLPLGRGPDGVTGATVPTRAFRPGVDEEAWLVQNNRAFAGHPEQGDWTLETIREREREEWFDPAGFRVLDHDGRIAGSCWTKVHTSAVPPLGEIYVIGVDPEFHGRGWGRALTVAGFDWLADAGLRHGMLYVDAANTSALTLYRSMGLTTHHVDRAYLRGLVGLA